MAREVGRNQASAVFWKRCKEKLGGRKEWLAEPSEQDESRELPAGCGQMEVISVTLTHTLSGREIRKWGLQMQAAIFTNSVHTR